MSDVDRCLMLASIFIAPNLGNGWRVWFGGCYFLIAVIYRIMEAA